MPHTLTFENIMLLLDGIDASPDRAIASLTAALQSLPHIEPWPADQDRVEIEGRLKVELGASYLASRSKDRASDVERGLALLQEACRLLSKEAAAQHWAQAKHDLARAYWYRTKGNPSENIELSISASREAQSVRTKTKYPVEWGKTQHNLALAYRYRAQGDPAENVETAIQLYEEALTVRTRLDFPDDWAMTINNLATAYDMRICGDRAENMERAIALSEAALDTGTRASDPVGWAATQDNLALSYSRRIRGDRARNVETAISLHEEVLEYRTADLSPIQRAVTLGNLALAYSERVYGNRAENIEKSIALNEASVEVRTRKDYPVEWARTQCNLASDYVHRIRGDRAQNIEKAISLYERALEIQNRDVIPLEWASTQFKYAWAFEERIFGNKVENLRLSVRHYEAALAVETPATRARRYLHVAASLVRVHLQLGQLDRAYELFEAARDAFLQLFAIGIDESEAKGVLQVAGSLFTDGAYILTERHQLGRAFAVAAEGRARLMSVALRLQSLQLDADQRKTLEELRCGIRTQSHLLDHATGLERSKALDKLTKLRSDLADLAAIGDRTQDDSLDAVERASRLVPKDGAIVMPIATRVGGKLLVVPHDHTGGEPHIVDCPGLTSDRLDQLISGERYSEDPRGWVRSAHVDGVARSNSREKLLKAIDEIAATLWEIYAGQLDETLSKLGIAAGAQLIIFPCRGLGLLPLGLAANPSTGQRFIDKYEISLMPSLDALETADRVCASHPAASLAAVVNPTNDLAFAKTERETLARYFRDPDDRWFDDQSAETAVVLDGIKEKTYWHFSTHGQFAPDYPRQSSLLLKDGARLTMGDLLDMQDSSAPRLVVLSACETGIHEANQLPDEFIGFPGVFMALGAAGVLGSLWPVDDQATSFLVGKFYQFHLGEGRKPAAALREAQLWLREATSDDLAHYSRSIAPVGQGTTGIAYSTDTVPRDHAEQTRFIGVPGTGGTGDQQPSHSEAGARPSMAERPFRHPYYWGGFVLTGL